MQLSLEQLQAFKVTVETGSFSAAARKLGKAQSSISGLIMNLEIDAGFSLFDRSSRSPKLTPEGLSLLNDINAVLNSHHNLTSRIANLAEEVEPEIAVAIDSFAIPHAKLLPLVARFEQKFPHTSLLLYTSPHQHAYHLISEGKANLAIALSKDDYPQQFAFRGISHAHYCTVVSNQHPLATFAQVTPQDLASYRHLRITDTVTGFRRFDSELSTSVWYSNDASLLIEGVKHGFGWAELPVASIEKDLQSGVLIKLPTTHQTVTFPHCVDMIWHSQGAMGVALNWLIDEFTQLGKVLMGKN
ncbi:LysR family transcriptional regulator [Thalassotalea mangrovi]|uniref:LysR family transcriptional regulator n=1 Tax=Thalassotalea mangrovi TaxID=2572245 RepID=A0A4U1B7E3_9GAMM|nr:LysR family transcriptional regulator [Thalassotalea mangrovi]TKB46370.1 LysR family transcriptional regulator [Thalassotalea mangrovi]